MMTVIVTFACCGICRYAQGEEVLFEDDFNGTLSTEWRAVGLKEEDYRIRDGGLEMRVQPGRRTQATPMLLVILPFSTAETFPDLYSIDMVFGETAAWAVMQDPVIPMMTARRIETNAGATIVHHEYSVPLCNLFILVPLSC